MATQPKWWKHATGYQIWPASYKDSNGDGVGDLPGALSTLDHLASLGVDFIWLSPVYDSPQHDMGYDVADYENIWPKYGTLQDMERLIAEANERGMRVVMDLVCNHTSHEHHWFRESRKSRDNEFSDWYIWRDGKVGADGKLHEPSNWRAAFGGSVWTWAPEREQYYLHLGLPEQPDLHWNHDAVRKGVWESAVDFWLQRGVAGFRMDVVNFYWKDPTFPDARTLIPGEQWQPMEMQHVMNAPEVHEWLAELRRKIVEKYGGEVVLIGETPATPREEVLKYVSSGRNELDMVFDFDFCMAGNQWGLPLHDFKPAALPLFKDAMLKPQALLSQHREAWSTAFLENHDHARSVGRFGPGEGEYHEAAAKMLALFLTCLSGTLFIYQGQEIGMTGVSGDWKAKDFRDEAFLKYLSELERDHPGDDAMYERGLEAGRRFGRDNARTPVQWNGGANVGFSTSEPWIRHSDNYGWVNVEAQAGKPGSILEFWKQVLSTRKQHSQALVFGDFQLLDRDNKKTFSFLKSSPEGPEKVLVVLNFSADEENVFVPDSIDSESLHLLMASAEPAPESKEKLQRLRPWEGRAYTCVGK